MLVFPFFFAECWTACRAEIANSGQKYMYTLTKHNL